MSTAQRNKDLEPLTTEYVLDLICDRLYLDLKVCAQNDVIPLFSIRTIKRLHRDERIPCMGLANKHTLNRIQQSSLPTLTIALMDRKDVPFYEAVPSEELSPEPELFPQYTIFAVWLPLRGYDCDEVEAILASAGCDAYVY